MREVNKILVKNQITEGGPIILYQIENELQETVHKADNTLVIYMEQLKKSVRDSGIVVPLTHNEKGQRSQSWSTDYQDVGGVYIETSSDSFERLITHQYRLCQPVRTGLVPRRLELYQY